MRSAAAVLVGFFVCGVAAGCGTSHHYADPEVKKLNPADTSQIVEPRGSPVIVVAVDGKRAGTRSEMQGRQFWIRPGIHHVVVTYNDGAKMSVHNAEVSFVSEAGRGYQLEYWPPKVKDLSTKKWVPNQVRVSEK